MKRGAVVVVVIVFVWCDGEDRKGGSGLVGVGGAICLEMDEVVVGVVVQGLGSWALVERERGWVVEDCEN